MTPIELRALVDRYIDAYNRKDVDGMLAVVHRDLAFRNISAGTVNASTRGVAEFEALARQSLPMFAERHQTVDAFEVNDGSVTVWVNYRAVVASDLPNGWRSGQVVELAGRSEFEFRDGKIVALTDIS
jgi:ketosteroid isomerase-like protein